MAERIEWIGDLERFVGLGEQWDRLAAGDATPFARHRWFLPWWQAFGGDRQLRICAVWRGSELVAAMPLCQRHGRLEAMVNEETPVFRAPARDAEALAAATEAVAASSAVEIRVGALGDGGSELDSLLAATRRHHRLAVVERRHVSPTVDTAGDFGHYHDLMSGHWREIERRRRKLRREHVTEFRPIEEPQDLGRDLEEVLDVEASGWKGEAGTAIASMPEVAFFYRSMARGFHELGQLRLSRLSMDGRLVAFDLALLHQQRYFLLKTGYDETVRGLGPGLSLRLAVIERCFEDGLAAHEFLGDDMAYKRLFATDERRHVLLRSYRRQPLGAARYAYRRVGRPLLGRAYRRVGRPLLRRAYRRIVRGDA